ncbi:hypothetical protein AB9K26_05035 [Psychroserpens sp. XS_ASV72]|uniref:hypothetical protein n=1 Tax=Psychroserpens sp. XS_ASV72 TaxID=3241293 RepID=UPI003518CE34
MKSLFLKSILFFLVVNLLPAQDESQNLEAINNYKYVIVPLKYDFLKEDDQYQLNSLTKFLFNKYGYMAFLDNEPFPEDLNQNRCLALKSEVVKAKGGFLDNRVQINLVDCKGNLVTTSKVGISREKRYEIGFNLALRDAFETFQFYNYKYIPSEDQMEMKSAVTISKMPSKKSVDVQDTTNEVKLPSDGLLYAQATETGYQVVDSSPKVVMMLLSTPKENLFMVKDQNAVVFKSDGMWYLSENKDGSVVTKPIEIKF